jgi:hypothetical protein
MNASRARGYKYAISEASSEFSRRSMLKIGAIEKARLVYHEWRNSISLCTSTLALSPHVAWCLMQLEL